MDSPVLPAYLARVQRINLCQAKESIALTVGEQPAVVVGIGTGTLRPSRSRYRRRSVCHARTRRAMGRSTGCGTLRTVTPKT